MGVHFFFWVACGSYLALGVQAMISKRASYMQKHADDIPEGKRFRANVLDLFLKNEISGTRTRDLCEDHEKADNNSTDDVRKAGCYGKFQGNVPRELLNKLKKRTAWPPLYWAKIRVFDLQMQIERRKWIPFLLPHEVIWSLNEHSLHKNVLFQHTSLCKQSLKHVVKCAAAMGMPAAQCIPLGMWGDGVPMNYDRTQSLDCLSFSLPGLQGSHHDLRFPITVMPKKYAVRHNTKDDIFNVVSWSLQHLAAGRFPHARHDAEPWQSSDVWRKKHSMEKLPRAILVEMRGDWAFVKECFRFPQHNETLGCCWLCGVTPSGIRNASSTAPWRLDRLSHWQVMQRLRFQGHAISPVFGIPYFQSHLDLMDWLHVADQGVSAAFLGSLFLYMLPRLPGKTEQDKVSHLFGCVWEYYESNAITSRLDTLTLKMLGKKGKAKLRGKAAEIRALINFAPILCTSFCDAGDVVDQTVSLASFALQACYANLSRNSYDRHNLATNSRKFCMLLVELEKKAQFRLLPKLHLFQELCEMTDINPSLTWCYRDEDFGGSLAALSRVRGGANRAANIAKSVLLKFCCQHKFPRL